MTVINYEDAGSQDLDKWELDNTVSEKQYEGFVKEKSKEQGWTVKRQVWDSDRKKRLDLFLFASNPFGNEFRLGLEVKKVKSVRAGSRFAEAWRQVREDYQESIFEGKKLDAVACSFLCQDLPDKKGYKNFEEFSKYFFTRSGVGFHVHAPPVSSSRYRGKIEFDNGTYLYLWNQYDHNKTGSNTSFDEIKDKVAKRKRCYR